MAERTPSGCRCTPAEIGCGHTLRCPAGRPVPGGSATAVVFPDLSAFLKIFTDPDALVRDHVPHDPQALRPFCVACSAGVGGVEWPCASYIGAAFASPAAWDADRVERRRWPVSDSAVDYVRAQIQLNSAVAALRLLVEVQDEPRDSRRYRIALWNAREVLRNLDRAPSTGGRR